MGRGLGRVPSGRTQVTTAPPGGRAARRSPYMGRRGAGRGGARASDPAGPAPRPAGRHGGFPLPERDPSGDAPVPPALAGLPCAPLQREASSGPTLQRLDVTDSPVPRFLPSPHSRPRSASGWGRSPLATAPWSAQFPNLKVRQGAFLSPVGPKWAPFVTGAEGPLIPGTQSTGLAKHEPLIHRKCFIDPSLWDKTLNLRSVQNDSVRRPPGL